MTKSEFKALSTEDALWACYESKPKVTSNKTDPLESANESLVIQINQNET